MSRQDEFSAKFLRCDNDSWVEYLDACMVSVTCNGVVVRNAVTDTLTADITKAAISAVDIMSPELIRIQTTAIPVALQFLDGATATRFQRGLEQTLSLSCNVKGLGGTEDMELIPDLTDAAVQQQIVRLLFSEEFDNFTAELSAFIEELSKAV